MEPQKTRAFCVRVARFQAKDLHRFAKLNLICQVEKFHQKWNPCCKKNTPPISASFQPRRMTSCLCDISSSAPAAHAITKQRADGCEAEESAQASLYCVCSLPQSSAPILTTWRLEVAVVHVVLRGIQEIRGNTGLIPGFRRSF